MKNTFAIIMQLFNRKTKWISIYLPMLILGVFFYFMMMGNVFSQTYDVERFDRAKETIRSPITVENEAETERKMRETVLAVSDRYTIMEEITTEQLNYVEEIFAAVETVTKNRVDIEEDEASSYNDDIVNNLQDVLSVEITSQVDDLVFLQLVQLDEKEREQGKTLFINAVEKVLANGVRIENIQSAKEEVKTVIKYSSIDENVKRVLDQLVDFAIVENSFFDVEKTMEARNEAASNIEPVIIHSGDIIVREGQIITNEIYEELKLVGVLDKERSFLPGIGLLLLVGLLVTFIGYELNRLYKRKQLYDGNIFALILISILFVLFMKVVSLYGHQVNYLYLLVPIAASVLLIKILITERLSIVFALVYAIIGSVLFNDEIPGTLNVEAGIYFLVFQLAAIMLLATVKDRGAIIKVSFLTALINIMTISIFILLSFNKYEFVTFITHAGFGAGAAIMSAVLTIGLLPFFETGLGILSDSKLLQLANPNQPLIRKLLTDAPGTYHHSLMVANLSETACEAIGANGLLARVGAYYHDIGKTIQPHYFIENQVGIQNPHDFIAPEQSAEIIIRHVTEGVKLLKEHKLPQEIIDITEQHHGTSLISYFYYKAKEENKEIEEEKFRYPGPKPRTKEAGIVSICDACEAAVRSLTAPSPEQIEELVSKIVDSKLMDGQLDETPLTLQEVNIIEETVCESLKGIFHSRIQYPTEEEK